VKTIIDAVTVRRKAHAGKITAELQLLVTMMIATVFASIGVSYYDRIRTRVQRGICRRSRVVLP
jgi:hypothetical protein